MDKTRSKYIYISLILSAVVAALYAYNCYFMVRPDGAIYSDVKVHIMYMQQWYDTGSLPDMCQAYPLYYWILRIIYHFIRDWNTVMMIVCIVLVFSINMLQIIFIRLLCGEGADRYAVATGTALSMVWPVSTYYYSFLGGPEVDGMLIERILLTSGSPNPIQSLTYMTMKPFALIALYAFISLMKSDDDRHIIRYAVIYAVGLFLSVVAKPCFYQAFAPAGVIYTIVYFLMRRTRAVFRKCLIMAAAYVPATLWVLYAMRFKLAPYVLSPLEGISINGDGTPVPVVLLRAVIYCVYAIVCVIIFGWKHRDVNSGCRLILLGILTYIFGTAEFLLLIETQNKEHLSMGWGYYTVLYVLYTLCITSMYGLHRAGAREGDRSVDSEFAREGSGRIARIMCIPADILLGIHAAFGLAVLTVNVTPWWMEILH